MIDFDEGLPLSSILVLNVESGRLELVRNKDLVNSMTVALASIFDKKVMSHYKRVTDQAIKQSDLFEGPVFKRNGDPLKGVEKQRAVRHTVQELNKLQGLLREGG